MKYIFHKKLYLTFYINFLKPISCVPSEAPQPGHKSLALCTVGNGHSRPFAHWGSTKEVFVCCNRLLQQVGRDKSLC